MQDTEVEGLGRRVDPTAGEGQGWGQRNQPGSCSELPAPAFWFPPSQHAVREALGGRHANSAHRAEGTPTRDEASACHAQLSGLTHGPHSPVERCSQDRVRAWELPSSQQAPRAITGHGLAGVVLAMCPI